MRPANRSSSEGDAFDGAFSDACLASAGPPAIEAIRSNRCNAAADPLRTDDWALLSKSEIMTADASESANNILQTAIAPLERPDPASQSPCATSAIARSAAFGCARTIAAKRVSDPSRPKRPLLAASIKIDTNRLRRCTL